MNLFNPIFLVAVLAFASPSIAEVTEIAEVTQDEEIDCDDPANAEHPVCLALLEPGVVGFVPLIGPGVAALLGAAALAGGGGATATVATPGT